MELTCTKCGKTAELPGATTGDLSTFVCDQCAEKVNIPAWEIELKELEAKIEKTESEITRMGWIKDKLASLAAEPKE